MKLAPLFIILFSAVGCSSLQVYQRNCVLTADLLCSPPRAGMIKLSEPLDREKPVGAIDPAGWSLAGDYIVGSIDNWLMARSMEDGAIRWWYKLDTPLSAPVHVHDGKVYAGLRSGELLKLDFATGKTLWRVSLGRFFDRRVVVSNDLLFVFTVDQRLYAIEKGTGKVNWIYDAGSSAGLMVRGGATPLVHKGYVYIGTSEGQVHSVRIDSGQLVWRHTPDFGWARFYDVIGELVMDDGRLIVARNDGTIIALTLEEGREAWRTSLPNTTASSWRSGILFIGCINGQLFALDSKTGKEIWVAELGQSISGIVAGQKQLYVVGGSGRLSAVAPESGRLIWVDNPGGILSSYPIYHGKKIYFSSGLKVLYGYSI